MLLLAVTAELAAVARAFGSDRDIRAMLVSAVAVGAVGLILALSGLVLPGAPRAGIGVAVAVSVFGLLLWMVVVAVVSVVRAGKERDHDVATAQHRMDV